MIQISGIEEQDDIVNGPLAAALSNSAEERAERALRPQTMAEIIGREKEKQGLGLMIESARKRGRALDHILFHGPPGLGKTSLAMVLASEMGVPLRVTTGPAISKAGDLASIITSLEEKSILFIDEIHRLRHAIEEVLYPAMEDKVLDIVIGKGPNAKTLRLDLPDFTIIGATTKLSMLSGPLRDRFGADYRLDFYTETELAEIVKQKAVKMEFEIAETAAAAIAHNARMTARVAVRILKRARDLAVVEGREVIEEAHVLEVLELMGIDSAGLDDTDRKILHSLYYNFGNKPVGLNTLAASISEEAMTIESVYEPFLLRAGLLDRTPRGRIVTVKAIELLEKQGPL